MILVSGLRLTGIVQHLRFEFQRNPESRGHAKFLDQWGYRIDDPSGLCFDEAAQCSGERKAVGGCQGSSLEIVEYEQGSRVLHRQSQALGFPCMGH